MSVHFFSATEPSPTGPLQLFRRPNPVSRMNDLFFAAFI
jgi:hypothetical protein